MVDSRRNFSRHTKFNPDIDIKLYIVDENIVLKERDYLKCEVLLPDRT